MISWRSDVSLLFAPLPLFRVTDLCRLPSGFSHRTALGAGGVEEGRCWGTSVSGTSSRMSWALATTALLLVPSPRGSPYCPLRLASEHPRSPLCSSSSTTLIPHTKVPAGAPHCAFRHPDWTLLDAPPGHPALNQAPGGKQEQDAVAHGRRSRKQVCGASGRAHHTHSPSVLLSRARRVRIW